MAELVVTAEAEAATALLFRTLAAHRATVANLPRQDIGRRLAQPDEDREQIQCQATLVRLLSITEAFCAERLLQQVEKVISPSRHHMVSTVWNGAAVAATRGWEDQRRSYKEWLGVQADWKVVERLAEARNAVAHGLGTLTRKQRRNEESVRAKLRAAGIQLEKGRIVLSDASLAAAAAACRAFIEEVDLAVQQRPDKFQ